MISTLAPGLKRFGLSLFANQIGVAGAAVLGPALSTLTNVNDLYLDHYFNNLTKVGS